MKLSTRGKLGRVWPSAEDDHGDGDAAAAAAVVVDYDNASEACCSPTTCPNWSRSALMVTLACVLLAQHFVGIAFAHKESDSMLMARQLLAQESHHTPMVAPEERGPRRSSYKKMKLKSHRSTAPPSYLPRILVPEFSAYLPVYGPSLYNINKIQLLPPKGPIKQFKAVEKPKENRLRPAVSAEPVVTRQREPIEMIERSIRTTPSVPDRRAHSGAGRSMVTVPRRHFRVDNFTTVRQPTLPTPYLIEEGFEDVEDSEPRRSPVDDFRPPRSRQNNHYTISEQPTALPPRADQRWRGSTSTALVTTGVAVKPPRPVSYRTTTTTTTTTPPPITTTTTSAPISFFSDPLWATRPQAQTLRTNTNRERKPKSKKRKHDPKEAEHCTAQKCRLPNCNCGGSAIPGGLKANDIPQLVTITFDDGVNDLNWGLYEEIFNSNRTNPNGCPIRGTFYVSHEWTDYSMVQNLYSSGHEIASHSISHSFGEKFSKQRWLAEISGQRELIALYGGVDPHDVRGMRAPFLQTGGNSMFEALYEGNFTYDSSLPVYENNPSYWPYTLDYALNHNCVIPPCPTRSYRGLWEVPMVMHVDWRNGKCSMVDACSHPPTEEEVYENFMKNFNRHWRSNKAPMPLYFHSAWFNTQHYRQGFMRFIDEINKMPDVYIVTTYQTIEWMRRPTPLSKMNYFEPFRCEHFGRRSPPCRSPHTCNLAFRHEMRTLKTCQPCPKSYPWTGNNGFQK